MPKRQCFSLSHNHLFAVFDDETLVVLAHGLTHDIVADAIAHLRHFDLLNSRCIIDVEFNLIFHIENCPHPIKTDRLIISVIAIQAQ